MPRQARDKRSEICLKRGRRFETQDPHAVPKSQIHGDEDTSDYVDAARQAIRASTDFNCGQDYRGFLEDVVVRFVITSATRYSVVWEMPRPVAMIMDKLLSEVMDRKSLCVTYKDSCRSIVVRKLMSERETIVCGTGGWQRERDDGR
jgi:hypothetical protein